MLSELAESTYAMSFRKLMRRLSFHVIHGPLIFSLLLNFFGTFIFSIFESNIGFELDRVVHLIVTLVIFVNYGLCNFSRFFGRGDTVDVSDCRVHRIIRIQWRLFVIIGLLGLCKAEILGCISFQIWHVDIVSGEHEASVVGILVATDCRHIERNMTKQILIKVSLCLFGHT